ncbi:MAG: hypothetical protein JWP82_404 [Humibacillus sp.]|nr:hypothetical protein [Humibacillus sp.]
MPPPDTGHATDSDTDRDTDRDIQDTAGRDVPAADEPEVIRVSLVDAKDRNDLRLQRIIDDLARRSEGQQHADVTAELVERIAEAQLPPMPQPWVDAVGAAAICGNPYVVSPTAAALTDVPDPETPRPEHDVT